MNRWLIGGAVALGVILLFALLFLSMRTTPVLDLEQFCAENEANCVATGPAAAEVQMIEVYDYACPACGNFARNVAQQVHETYVESGDVRWIYFPISLPQFRDLSVSTGAAALCVAEQDRDLFLAFHEQMFAIQEQPQAHTREAFEEAAAAAGADVDALNECLESGRHRQTIEENIQAANDANVRATPSFYLDGQAHTGIGSFEQIRQLIDPRLAGQ